MFQYDLMWLISFPLVCAIMLWFSLDLAVLVRVGGGRRRRANARRAIERLILNSPVSTAVSVVQSPSTQTSPSFASRRPTQSSANGDRNLSASGSSEEASPHARGAAPRPAGPTSPLQQQFQQVQKVREVAIPAALRIATRAVVRRAVVLVGGDFARSPRMQYHAASLARSGLVDEVLLVGLDCGNQLSEDLLMSGEPYPERFVIRGSASGGAASKSMEQAVYDVEERLRSPEVHKGHGCVVSTRYLAKPPTPPEWLQTVFPLRSLHWVVCTLYRVMALTLLFVLQLSRAVAIRINEHGQLLVTDVILVQTPPAVPFVLLVKYVVCPAAFVYNMLLYYCVVVPAAWMNPAAMRDVRQQCRLQSLRFQAPEGDAAALESVAPAGGSVSLPRAMRSAAQSLTRSRIRPWVFYPAILVDWHNYGYTILEQNQRPTTAVQLYKLFEVHLCAGHLNATVSQAMRHSLEAFYPWMRRQKKELVRAVHGAATAASSTGMNGHGAPAVPPESSVSSAVTVLYDVAPSFFRPVSRRRCVREVLDRLRRRPTPTSPLSSPPTTAYSTNSNDPFALVSMSELEAMGWGIAGPPSWVFAEVAADTTAPSVPSSPLASAAPSAAFGCGGGGAGAASCRGIMMVGSTSWTDEDDYSVLIRALQRLDHRLNFEVAHAHSAARHPNSSGSNGSSSTASSTPLDLWVLITGKGPARQRFEEAVRAAKLSSHVVVSTYYAQSYQEYSVLLGAADVGFCLHFSSSGLDLPMKGVDMVGAGLPVIALQYPAIEELMGGVTRVLAPSRAIGCPSHRTPDTFKAPPALVECDRGWLFQGEVDLEALLSSFVGLPPAAEPAWSSAMMMQGSGGKARGGVGNSSYPTTSLAPTPLAAMKRRSHEARLHARTWEENWSSVLLPVLKQVV